MGNFKTFQEAVKNQFDKMATTNLLFVTGVSKDDMWELYLTSFPEGSNPFFRERREYDCQTCKHFIRSCGNVVSIVNNQMVSIWDLIELEDIYQPVADALSSFVKSAPIENIFLHFQTDLGMDHNTQRLENGDLLQWNHFHYALPRKFVPDHKDSIGTSLSVHKSNQGVLKRGLSEITLDSAETVLDLIAQNSLYRGDEHKPSILKFLEVKKEFDKLSTDTERDNFCWKRCSHPGIKNSVIGTLLFDISSGVSLDEAVRMFESKVAPTNYKRPTALVTKAMIENAQKTVVELGIESSLYRRFAVAEDLTINNVIFANREARKEMSVFDELNKKVPVDLKKLKKITEVDIDTFMTSILPKADGVELMFENKHVNNLVSLIAPINLDSKNIFKWGNNFSWSYIGELTDSIRERVRKAGGNIIGILRCSLSWFNTDDLDIHLREPTGNHIYFSNKGMHPSSGKLDVDMNVSNPIRNAVENIIYTNIKKMQEGIYSLEINNFRQRETVDVGFDVEVEFDGNITTFHYDKIVKETIEVAKFEFSRTSGIKFLKTIPSSLSSKNIWGIDTNQFHKVSIVMNSPNHWNGESTGNKHYFFILDGCRNDRQARGFFNEFLDEGLTQHRKVFEILGNTLRVEESDQQLSGLGFSSTQRSSVLCKITGSFERMIRINF